MQIMFWIMDVILTTLLHLGGSLNEKSSHLNSPDVFRCCSAILVMLTAIVSEKGCTHAANSIANLEEWVGHHRVVELVLVDVDTGEDIQPSGVVTDQGSTYTTGATNIRVEFQLGPWMTLDDRDSRDYGKGDEFGSHRTAAFSTSTFVGSLSKVLIHSDSYAEYHLDTIALAQSPVGAHRLSDHLHRSQRSTEDSSGNILPHMDCFYHGHAKAILNNVSVAEAPVAISLCGGKLNMQFWFPHNHTLEVVPYDSGHVALFRGDFKFPGQCGNNDDTSDGLVNSMHMSGWNNVAIGARRRRNDCVKTVEMIFLNDQSLHDIHEEDTEHFVAQVFSSISAKFLDGVFACRFDMRLVGQITFRHGLPDGIIQRSCGLPYYLKELNLTTAVANPCCAAADPCNSSCPASERVACLDETTGVTLQHIENTSVGCYRPTPASPWRSNTCESNGAIVDVWKLNDPPVLATASASNNDAPILLATVSRWVNQNQNELSSIFGGAFDLAAYLSAESFGMGTGIVGLATLGLSCTRVRASINFARTSITGAANILTHEIGHNLGLPHVVPPTECSTNTSNDTRCGGQKGVMGRGTIAPGSSTWTITSTARMDSLFPPVIQDTASGHRLAGGTFGNHIAGQGRLEVFVNGSWGAVCSRGGVSAEAARLVCRSMGANDGTSVALPGPDNVSIAIESPSCSGSEQSLVECNYTTAGNCNPSLSTVYITCIGAEIICDGNGWLNSENCSRDAALLTNAVADYLGTPPDWSIYCSGRFMRSRSINGVRRDLATTLGVDFNGTSWYGTALAVHNCSAVLDAIRERFGELPQPTSGKACVDGWRDEHNRPETACGDGILESGEQCDPGLGSGDMCCLPNCTFAPNCECANTDPCCENGRYLPQGTVCRVSLHLHCDSAEVCSGISSECPADVFELSGTSCTTSNRTGMCHLGRCMLPTSTTDCARIFPARPNVCDQNRGNRCNIWCRSADSSVCYSNGARAPDGTPCGEGKQCYPINFHLGASDERVAECVPSNMLNLPPSTMPPTVSPTTVPTTSTPSLSPSNVPTNLPSAAPSFSPTTSPSSRAPSLLPTSGTPSVTPTESPTGGPSTSPPTSIPTTPSPSTQPTVGPRAASSPSDNSTSILAGGIAAAILVVVVVVVVVAKLCTRKRNRHTEKPFFPNPLYELGDETTKTSEA